MKAIYKYPLEIMPEQIIQIPDGAVFLSVQLQNGALFVWVLVDLDQEKVDTTFHVIATGENLEDSQFDKFQDENGEINSYIGTVLMAGGKFVWHVFVT